MSHKYVNRTAGVILSEAKDPVHSTNPEIIRKSKDDKRFGVMSIDL